MGNQSDFTSPNIWTSTDSAFILMSETASFVSMAGCMFIIALYIAFKELRTTSRLLLVFLSVADIGVCVSTLFQTRTYSVSDSLPDQMWSVCQVSAAMLTATQVSVALWSSAVAAYLFMCVTLHWVSVANRMLVLFHIFCWGMPVVVTTAADLSGVYGYNTADILVQRHPTACWVSGRVGNRVPWYFITVEGWTLASFCLICLFYVPITFSVIRNRNKGRIVANDDVIEELAQQTANEQLRFIPMIFVCTRLWGSAHFLFTRYPDDSHLRASDWLMIFRAVGDNSQGIVNAIFFCLATKQIRKLLFSRLQGLICCLLCCFSCCFTKTGRARGGWVKVYRQQRRKTSRTRTLDGSDLDISGISLDLPTTETRTEEDEVIFER